MFRNWAVAQPFGLRSVMTRARTSLSRRPHNFLITLLVLSFAAVLSLAAHARAAGTISGPPRGASRSDVPQAKHAGSLRLGLRYGDPADADQVHKNIADLLALVACLDDFDCRLSTECLSRSRPTKMTVAGPFQDVLLDLPVRGVAHVEGALRLVPVHDAARAVFDVTIEGTARLQGAGQTRGVRIQSSASARFRATKRVFLDQAGMTCLPATCNAATSLAIKDVSSDRPMILGRFAERIARRRVGESRKDAEAECSDHLVQAMRAAIDREFDRLAGAANAALAEHLAAATKADKTRWQQVRFRTEADSLQVARHVDSQALLTAWKPEDVKSAPAVWLCLPCAKLDVMTKLAGLGCLGMSGSSVVAANRIAIPAQPQPPALRPAVNWHEGTLTVALDFEPAARLAREPAVGAAQ